VVVVLLGTDVRADILGRHQPDIMPFRGKETADMMSTAARLQGDGAGWQTIREVDECSSPDAAAQNDLSFRVQAHYAVQVLAQIDSKSHDGHRFAPSSQSHRHPNSEPAGGAGHPIKDADR